MATVKTSVPGSGYGNAYIDTLVWGGTTWDVTNEPIKVWFGSSWDFDAAHEVHGDSESLPSGDAALDWNEDEISVFAYALNLYQSVCGLRFQLVNPEVESVREADIVWWKTDLGEDIAGRHEVPNGNQSWAYFNPATESWQNLAFGGDGLHTVLHELGHGMGLAHPHDGGGEDDATTFPGVDPDDSSSLGTHGLNQGVWTVMSYNTGWSGAEHDITYGAQGGLGAFDIAALQALYGKNMTTATGKNTYDLPTFSEFVGEEGWSCIWDAGGVDTLSAVQAQAAVTLDLRAATLMNGDPNAGGFISREAGVAGGFTIANGVVIENASGGAFYDRLYGNSAGNALKGNGGNDKLYGYAGNDLLYGGSGSDTLSGSTGKDAFIFEKRPSKTSNMDRIADFDGRYDTIHLDNAVFKKLGRAGKLKSSYLEVGSKADDRNDHLVYNKSKGILYYDADGSGRAKAVEIAALSNKAKLNAGDFLVI